MSNDEANTVKNLEQLLSRTYDLIDYTQSKRDDAPYATADRKHPGHAEHDDEYAATKQQLHNDIKMFFESQGNTLKYRQLQARLRRRIPTVPSGHSPQWGRAIRCRCWWDEQDELQEIAEYL